MVCLGNICRSPMAEGILKNKLKSSGIQIDSVGTAAYHTGESPDYRAIDTARRHNIDISGHIARQFKTSDFSNYDIIYVMDEYNYNDLLKLSGNAEERSKIKFITDVLHPGMKVAVPDPYYGGSESFELTYQVLNKSCDEIAAMLTNNYIKIRKG